jgi:release factor glutamine methyltransferase
MSIQPLPRQIAERLPGETPGLDAQVLLAHVTGQDRAWVLSHPEAGLTPEQEAALETAIRRLQAGTPLPYILGHWEFFGLDFEVTPAVLIPRPETELLLETALNWIRIHPQSTYRFLDVGTGSGCIAVTLAVHVPRAQTLATDISPVALAVARRNAERHGVEERIEFIECDLLPDSGDSGRWTLDGSSSTLYGLLSTVDMLTANLPYIPTETLKGLAISTQEPALALDGGADGLDLIRRLLANLAGKMDTGCLVLLEIETGQGRPALELAHAAFPGANVEIKKDLAGHDRLVVIET